ncbi:MAG: (2Fe-2S)-binding protein [Deltaproteobacteria bacterium]|nr:(2Fe-2S)-binding protein [Deltaproteobacteria bacterium]
MVKRLSGLPTLRIDPEKQIFIQYNAKTYKGFKGDTIASLLYADGIRIFSRSIKYHRPRGLYSLNGESANTLMEVDGIPNVPAENTLARSGMMVQAQNVPGNHPERDPMRILDKLHWAMPAGFYYRRFHKPAALWPFFANWIRRAAGIGRLKSDFEMKGRYDEIYLKADVCVIGGGPAGMSAAVASAKTGLRVVLLENRPWLGGDFEYRYASYGPGGRLYERARDLSEKVEQTANIRVFTHTAVIGAYSDNLITAFQRGAESDAFSERYVEIRSESVVVATGCIERPLLFENNELPGVMQAGCAHRLARTWGLLPGESAVFSIGHDMGLEAAVDLSDLGLKIVCVADTRKEGHSEVLLSELKKRNIHVLKGWTAVKAHGRKTLNGVTLTSIDGTGSGSYECDTLVASAGLTPLTGLMSLLQVESKFDAHTGFFLPHNLPPKMHLAGRIQGLCDPLSIETSGYLAGLRAAADCGQQCETAIREAEQSLASWPGPVRGADLVSAPVSGKKTFICFDEDTTLENIHQAIDMGFDVPELIKRFTAAGTGPGQGAIAGHNLPLYLNHILDLPESGFKPTMVRSPLIPTYLATYAGTNRDMSKRTPVHVRQVMDGGKMVRVGLWHRARHFGPDRTCRQEVLNVRTNVGMLDASTLGKFRIHGPDALKALERIYVGDMSNVSQEKVKYSAMCNEDGCVIDDGVVIKRGENDYYFTTTTARAGSTIEWFRYHTRYDRWEYHIVNLTDAFGVINLAGPNAREVLRKVTDADVSNASFPYGGYREFVIGNSIPVRAVRLGFLGELSYELHCPSSYMLALWDILAEAGKRFGIQNFGLEAQNILRMEKGHIIIGSETEQRTTLHDVGLGFLWHRGKPEARTVGSIALAHTENQKGRLKLVGFRLSDGSARPPRDGSIIVEDKIRGYVCIARYSETLKEVVGMALVEDFLSELGNRLKIYEDDCKGKLLYARVAKMPFYDPQGQRMRS